MAKTQQDKKTPLVSVGIPTFNRPDGLRRAVECIVGQTYKNIEIIVSDNCTPGTIVQETMRRFMLVSPSIRFFRQGKNNGPGSNFKFVLEKANGQYFMWLGDDDWLDPDYITICVQRLMDDHNLSLVYGSPKYYRNGKINHDGKTFNLEHDEWWCRVIAYYKQVTDNGMFYGVMHTAHIKGIDVPHWMGGDWFMIASIASLGKVIVVPEISMHRELGGATASYHKIASVMGISRIHAIFPMWSIAIGAWLDIVFKGSVFKARPFPIRLVTGSAVFCEIIYFRVGIYYWNKKIGAAVRFLKRLCLHFR